MTFLPKNSQGIFLSSYSVTFFENVPKKEPSKKQSNHFCTPSSIMQYQISEKLNKSLSRKAVKINGLATKNLSFAIYLPQYVFVGNISC